MIEALIALLVVIIVVGIVAWLVVWLIDMLPIDPKFRTEAEKDLPDLKSQFWIEVFRICERKPNIHKGAATLTAHCVKH